MKKNKRGLVLSGGGALGAYELGVLESLINSGRHWDIISGVSVGSLNALGLAMNKKEDFKNSFQQIKDIWLNISNEQVYKKHAWGWFNYIFSLWKGSLYSMAPLEKLVIENLDFDSFSKSDIEVIAGVTCLQNGNYYPVKLNGRSPEEISKIVHASCVFPAMFQPVKLVGVEGLPDGDYIDGGVRDTVPVRSIVSEVDEIDVIITAPVDGAVEYKQKFTSVIDIGLRAAFIMADEVMISDRLQGLCGHHDVKLNLYAPQNPLKYDGFEFNPRFIFEMIEIGHDETYKKNYPTM